MRAALGALAALVACLLLGSCTSSGASGSDDPGRGGSSGEQAGQAQTGGVDVDTQALRRLKAKAGIAPCPRSRGAAGDLPDLTLACLGGGRDVDLAHLHGPMVINLFAQWCGPCRQELPYYETLARKAKGSVSVVGVDYLDTQPAGALRLARQSGVTYPLLADPAGRLRPAFKVRGLPGIVFVDRSGHVSDVEFRLIGSYRELRALVRQHLGVSLPA